MKARLTFTRGSKAGEHLDIEVDDVTIGRSPEVAVQFLQGEALVSGFHATIFSREGKHFIRDEDSRNGTYVNGKRVSEQLIRSGDIIEFGQGGPAIHYSTATTLELIPTLDGSQAIKTSDLYRLAITRSNERGSGSFRRPFTVTGEFITLAHKRSTRAARIAMLSAAIALMAVVSVTVWTVLSRAELQNTLNLLAADLEGERNANVSLNRDLTAAQTALQSKYDSLQRLFDLSQEQLTRDAQFGQDVINSYMRGVALLTYLYGFVDQKSGRMLRYRMDSNGRQIMTRGPDGARVPSLSFAGDGPPVEKFGSASGFLVDSAGWIITNRHVAEPWEDDTQLAQLRRAGANIEAVFTVLRAYFPPGTQSYALEVDRVSQEHDVALLRSMQPITNIPVLPLAPPSFVARPGQQMVFIGYPTGIHNLMFRVSREERSDIVTTVGETSPPLRFAEELARRGHIQPLVVTGSVSDTTGGEVIHTAETTGGGSGGPIIGPGLDVIAIHYAYVTSPIEGDPFRTQRAVKVSFAWDILPDLVRTHLTEAP